MQAARRLRQQPLSPPASTVTAPCPLQDMDYTKCKSLVSDPLLFLARDK